MLTGTSINIVRCLRKKIPYHSIILKNSLSSVQKKNIQKNIQINSGNQLKTWQEIEGSDQSSIDKSITLRLLQFIHNSESFNPWTLTEFLKSKAVDARRKLQKRNPVLEECVGFELSVAYFLLFNRGKVKFKGHDNWTELKQDRSTDLPKKYDPNYVVTEIDASEVEIFYEGLENFRNAQRIKRAIFKKSPLFDDWFLDRISSYFPYLEYLDISECPKVSERGLVALYKCSELKTLVVTNYAKTAAFELTCMMLEDCVPGLTVKILDSK